MLIIDMAIPISYIGPATPRWSPSTEADLASALTMGLLAESHYVELKREVALRAGANKELARDLASLAVDGGLLLVGVEEDKTTRQWSLYPIPLAGLGERIDQVARSLIDPPLHVRFSKIAASRSGDGYLLVHVPPSPLAPHMVDHRYIGRAERTKAYLSDAEVRRLHDQQVTERTDAQALVEFEIRRDLDS